MSINVAITKKTMELPAGAYLDTNYKLYYADGTSLLDGLPEDMQDMVHSYWGTFPPQNPLIGDVFGLVLFVLWVISFLGNGLILWIFLTTKELRTPTNMFTVNLAFSDWLMMTTHGPPVVINAFLSDYWVWGPLACRLFGALGGVFGVASIMTMVVIGWDRYNLIVKGLTGTEVTPVKAFLAIIGIWTYAILSSCPPFLWGWGDYKLEGLMLTCGYDYMTEDWNHQSYILYAFTFDYVVPMILVLYFYSQIVKTVFAHEAALRAQAKKMNVENLRANQDSSKDNVEFRIAKVAITNVFIWAISWTPYAVIVMTACFGNRSLITPVVTQIPAFILKFACCFNPIVFAASHPLYRQVLSQKIPCLGIYERQDRQENEMQLQTETTQN